MHLIYILIHLFLFICSFILLNDGVRKKVDGEMPVIMFSLVLS